MILLISRFRTGRHEFSREIESYDSNILHRDIQQMFQIRQLSWFTCNILRLVCQFTAQYLFPLLPNCQWNYL